MARVAILLTLALLGPGCGLGSCGSEPFVAPADAGSDAADGGGCSDPSCFVPPLPAATATGAVAAGVLTAGGDGDPNAIGGPGAVAQAGDLYLRNDCIRVVVQQAGRIFSTIPTGGNIIDADLVRAPGAAGADEVGELTGYLGGMLYPVFDEVAIAADGSDGRAAVIVGKGHLDVLEYMNIPALLMDTGFGAAMDQVVADADLLVNNAEVWVRYALFPGECRVRVTYTFYHRAPAESPPLSTSVGAFYAAAGEGTSFIPGFGFGPISPTEAFTTPRYTSRVFGNVGRNVAYALRAARYYDAAGTPTELGDSSQVTISGLTVTIFGEPAPLAALSPPSRVSPFVVPPGSGASFELLFGVGRDLAAAQAAVANDPPALVTPSGHVVGAVAPAAVLTENARVVVFADYDLASPAARRVVSRFVVGPDGAFAGDLPAGSYVLEVDLPGYPHTAQKVTVAADATVTVPTLTVPATGTIAYHVTAAGAAAACRLSVIGAVGDKVTGIRSPQYRDTLFDTYNSGLAYVEVTSECSSDATGPGTVGPLAVLPGTYRIVVSHGPEFGILDRREVVVAAGATVDVVGDLPRAIDSSGWAAVDLHQHAFFSFDSRLPHERRLTAYLAEGIDFFGASEHDRVFDYHQLLDELGYTDRLATMTGSEISPMHYGHFNAFELPEDYANPVNGGSPDWSGGPNRTVVSPDDLLGWALDRGADLISANHPRAPDPMTFFYWFDRCGFRVDFAAATSAGAVGCDPALAVVPWDKLDLAYGTTLWTDKFDLLEIMNRPTPMCRRARKVPACADGQEPEPCVDPASDPAGRIFDPQIELILQDWFNMLQVGFVRTIVGNSDSHKISAETAGLPRSFVFVGAGQDSPANPQLKQLVKAALVPALTAAPPRLAGAAVATNGPFVTVTVHGEQGGAPTSARIGELLRHDGDSVTVAAHVEAPPWMDVDRLEVFVNQEADIYDPAILPRAAERNDPTVIQPFGQQDPNLVVPLTVWQTAGSVRSCDVEVPVTLPGFSDAWIVVRVSGSRPLFPVLPDRACFAADADPARDDPFFGTTASAITNPVFVDRDGVSGWRAPAAP